MTCTGSSTPSGNIAPMDALFVFAVFATASWWLLRAVRDHGPDDPT